jgi:hypothetical protein
VHNRGNKLIREFFAAMQAGVLCRGTMDLYDPPGACLLVQHVNVLGDYRLHHALIFQFRQHSMDDVGFLLFQVVDELPSVSIEICGVLAEIMDVEDLVRIELLVYTLAAPKIRYT